MHRSIATVSLSGTLPEKLEAIAVARFDGVEIFENDLTFFHGSPRDIGRLAADLGLSIDLFQPFRDFEGVDDATLARNLDRAERKFDLMGELGAPLMLVCSNVGAQTIDDDARAAAQLHALAERASKRGIRIGYEALAWGRRVNRYQQALGIVEQAAHPHLGLILDSFHTLAPGFAWDDLAQIDSSKLFFVQLADAPRLGMEPLPLSRHFRCFPGQGDLDVAGFADAIVQSGYTGTFSLEIFSDELRAAPPRQAARDAMRSMLFLEEQIRRQRPDAKRRVALFDPPPAPDLAGVGFVEFAADGADAEALETYLASFGFVRLGRHRSKDVTLFGQGDIRFVLNSEPDSLAQSYYLMHGPSVCALALDVGDPGAAMARADAFGCPRVEGRIGPEELAIPALRARDGSLIYFTGRDGQGQAEFERDFVLEPPASAGVLTRIDHIARALPEGELDSWVLFYRSVLGLDPEPTWVLPDPYGLVRSRAVSDPARRVRIPLNIASGRRTATQRSLSVYSGAGVHHIAFETSDIWTAARQLQRLGAPVLTISDNYYDDIAARFGLTPQRVAALRAANILYDRAEDGELLHLYSMPFQDRFFFEIIQRVGGYDAYGASNAPARMAALAQMRAGLDMASVD